MHVLRVQVLEGRGFGPEVDALSVHAAFAGETKSTPVSVAASVHSWNSSLVWAIEDRAAVRRVQAGGGGACKLEVRRRDGARLGWVVLPLRQAKMNQLYGRGGKGEWLQLTAAKTLEPPSLCIAYSFGEEVEPLATEATAAAAAAAEGSSPGPEFGLRQRSASLRRRVSLQQDASAAAGAGAEEEVAEQLTAAVAGPAGAQQQGDEEREGPLPLEAAAAEVAAVAGALAAGAAAAAEAAAAADEAAVAAAEAAATAAAAAGAEEGAVAFITIGGGAAAPEKAGAKSNDQPSVDNTAGLAAAAPAPVAAPAAPVPAPSHTAASVTAAAPASGIGGVDPVRQFSFGLDVRSLQAGRRLPLSVTSAYVQAYLPSEMLSFLAANNATLPPRATPLRTHPSVDIARGSEGALPNGFVSLEFGCGVMALAALLASGPQLTLEVWHKERSRADTLLGVATVPLVSLLDAAWVDKHYPVVALMARAGDTALSGAEERVQVALLRVVLSLQEATPAVCPEAAAAAVSAQPVALPAAQQPTISADGPAAAVETDTAAAADAAPQLPPYLLPSPTAGPAATAAPAAAAAPPAGYATAAAAAESSAPPKEATVAAAAKPGECPAEAPAAAAAAAAEAGVAAAAAAAVQAAALVPLGVAEAAEVRAGPEYLVAWELEVWKKAEEAKWRAELKEREQQRMAALEAEWRRRDRARESEAAALRASYAALESKAAAVLSAAEAREAKVLAADAALARRRGDLEREHAARMAEAEAAVRRLQVECEHQLAIERDRCAEASRGRAAAEARAAAAEAKAAAAEAAFEEFKHQQRSTPEAELQRQLADARREAEESSRRAARTAAAKKRYKEQLLAMAAELAAAHKERQLQSVTADAAAARRREADVTDARLRAAAAAEAAAVAERRRELFGLHAQLQELREGLLGGCGGGGITNNGGGNGSGIGFVDAPPAGWHGGCGAGGRDGGDIWRWGEEEGTVGGGVGVGYGRGGHQEAALVGLEGPFGGGPGSTEGPLSPVPSPEVFGGAPYGVFASPAGRHLGSPGAKMQSPAAQHQHQHHQEQQQQLLAARGGLGGGGDDLALLSALLNSPSNRQRPRHWGGGGGGGEGADGWGGSEPAASPRAQGDCGNGGGPSRLAPASGCHGDAPAAADAVAGSGSGAEAAAKGQMASEVQRLLRERTELLATGLYARDDEIIRQLDGRIAALAATG